MACTQNRVNDKEDDDENDKNHNGISPTATLDGDFLQDSIEVFQIIKSNMPNVDHRHSKENDHHMVLYYGDVVQLVQTGCTTNTNIAIPTAHVLTCTSTSTTTTTAPTSTTTFTNSNPSNTNRSQSDATASHTIQFVPYKDWSSHRSPITSPPLQQLWKILSTYEPSTTITTTSSSSSSSTNYPNTIKVGHAALEEDAIQRQWSSYPNQSTRNQIPVRYNDNIVLRNCSTGGILSCSSRGEIGRSTTTDSSHLHILTDAAFQPHIDMTNYQETEVDDENSSGRKHNYTRTSNMNNTKRIILPHHETSAISRLQQSSQFIPSMYEIFSLVHPAVPIMPLWIKPPPFRLPNQEQQLQLLRPSFTTACYMDMSYLLYPDRHEIMEDIAGTFLHQSLNVYDNNDHDDILPDTGSPTIAQQEQILLYELINACVGMEGRWIRAEVISDCSTVETTNSTIGAMNNIQFRLYDDRRCRWDVIVRRLIEDMLLLPTLFVRIQYFMHYHTPGYEYGHVMQAYCCRLGQLLHDYIATVVSWYQQYKKGSLTLTTFQIELHTSIRALSILYQICQTVQCHKGGALINAIRQWQRTRSDGDTVSEQMVSSLLDVVSVPFIQRLLDWLELGVLSDDPFSEFMIQCCYDPNTSWENQYTLVSKNVLEGFFATDQLVEQVLATGRYWNAIRSCRSNHRHEELVFQDTNSGPTSIGSRIQYSSNISSVSAFILTKYRDSSRSLLRLLIDDFDLVHVLRTMKQYFLLEHGDFFVNFLDCAEDELLKDVTKISRTKIQHWMNSCRQSLVDDEKDVLSKGNVLMNGLQCCISTDGLADYLDKLHAASGGIDTKDAWTPMRHTYGGTLTSTKGELTGLDTFYIDLTPIPFPLSTVLSSNAIGCYHLLFRHLFYAKYVERRMVSIWNDHQMMKELKSLRGPMGATFLLRQRMLHLLQNLIYYMILEVIEPNWLIMEKAINAPTSNTEATVDDILQHHTQFLQRTLEACLLTNRDVVRALTKLLKTCLLFSEQMKRFMKASKLEEERNAVAIEKEKDAQHDFYSRLTKRTMAKAPVKHLQDHFRQNRSDRLDRVQRQSARIEREVCGEPYQRMITRFEEVFTKNLKDFMIQINNSDDIYHTHKVNLCIRLDYNGYITSSLGLG
jgi:gamma-tubulin complex component 2